MTWIIGTSTPFGYGVMISDICVTFPNGETQDILQKAYPVGKFIVGGFAGSVKIGFQLLESLRKFLKLPKENAAWCPDWVAENWSPIAKRIYDKNPQQERSLGSEILMVGVSPNEDIGIPGFAKSCLCVLRYPCFTPEISWSSNIIYSIGSGSQKEKYIEILKGFTKEGCHPLMQLETGSTFGWGKAILIELTYCLENNPEKNISKHLQIFIVKRGEILQGNNDYTFYPSTSKKAIEIKMPPVAQGYPQFIEMIQKFNLKAGGVVC